MQGAYAQVVCESGHEVQPSTSLVLHVVEVVNGAKEVTAEEKVLRGVRAQALLGPVPKMPIVPWL